MSGLSRRVGAIGLAAVLVGTCLGAGTASAVDDVNTKKLRNAVTVNGILQHERALQVIANKNGGTRASGTSGYLASVQYVTQTLRRAGYTVSRQKFTFPYYNEVTPGEVQQVSPTPTTYETATLGFSGTGDVTGVLVPTNDLVIPATPNPSSTSGCEASDFPAAPAGPAVALVQRGTCTFEQKVNNAEAAGYEAVLVFNEGNGPTRSGLLENVTLGTIQDVPVNGLSYADGVALAAAAAAGPVTVRVAAQVEYDPERETYNVIANSPKGKNANEVVVVGAHLDSVTAGPGINDNGSGSATILEIAEQMAELNYTNKLQRQVRFAFWGAEEFGLLGSEHYVENLSEANRAKIYANLNFDMVGSPNYVRFVYDGDGSDSDPADPVAGPPGSGEIEKIFTDYFTSQGLATAPTAFDGRSDYGPFIAAGIPAGGLFSGAEGIKTEAEAAVYGGTAGEPYDACYHQACDTITNLNTGALAELGDAAAHAVLTLTRSKSGLYPDGSRQAQRGIAAVTELPQHGHHAVR